MPPVQSPAQISERQYREISALVKSVCGINLHEGKMSLVQARLSKRLRVLGVASFDEYLERLRGPEGGRELVAMLDALSTNLTSFFREPAHFDHLCDAILQRHREEPKERRLRLWSAGCSTGEEPYSIAIRCLEAVPDLAHWDARILATDLCTQVLERAREGRYSAERMKAVPHELRLKYFAKTKADGECLWQVCPDVRGLVQFARLNLLDAWPMTGPFDVVFCRNVMIYFDKPTQQALVGRFWELLRPGGTLFLGHSESLTGVQHRFRYVQPTVYAR